jgi:hypothetical protein
MIDSKVVLSKAKAIKKLDKTLYIQIEPAFHFSITFEV